MESVCESGKTAAMQVCKINNKSITMPFRAVDTLFYDYGFDVILLLLIMIISITHRYMTTPKTESTYSKIEYNRVLNIN